MSTKIVNRAARTRCYKCGSPELSATCHHCGRAMCAADKPKVWDDKGKPYTEEFSKLWPKQQDWARQSDRIRDRAPAPYHCEDCDHVVKRRLRWLWLAGAGAAALGVLLMFASFGTGLVVFLLGAAAAGGGYYADTLRVEQAKRARPLLPVVPNIDSITMVETLHGKLTLDEQGDYYTRISPVHGRLDLAMTFGRPDQDRLQTYRAKYELARSDDIGFSAGFAVLSGQAGLEFTDPAVPGTIIPLHGAVADHAFFDALDGRASAQWNARWKYRLDETVVVESIPLWLTPSLVPASDQRVLEIELQWNDLGSAEDPIGIDRIEPVTLLVPVGWGNVEYSRNGLSSSTIDDPDNPGEAVRKLEWAQLPLTKDERSDRRVALSVRFEHRIELTDTVRGSLKVAFKGALSGVRDVEVYHPLGDRRADKDDKKDKRIRTEITADFSLSLRRIRYQDVRVVPDSKQEVDRHRQETEEFRGVVPDHETVINLTNAMSVEEYYIKRVTENPPRSGGRANVVNRYWDIAGRRYDGVYPVDFHLILTGEEVYSGDIRAQAGNTKIRLTVQGAYASAEMKKEIEDEWDRLHWIMVETLKKRPHTRPVGAAEQANGTTPRHSRVDEETASRRKDLRKRRDEVTDAFLQGRVPEDIYRKLVADIDEELSEHDNNGHGV